ncbi:MAG: helix-turn-helix transcriptional regulator [Polyangiales bacterium]
MKQSSEAAITVTEAAYDLHATETDWFPRLLSATVPLIDHGLGVTGLVGTQPDGRSPIMPEAMHVATGPSDFPARLMRAMSELPRESIIRQIHPGIGVLSEVNAQEPRFLEAWRRHIDYARDGIGVTAMDPNGRVVHVVAPVPDTIALSDAERNRWQMLAAHMSAGLRLRGVLADSAPVAGSESEGLPCEVDAVIDANTFRVDQAMNGAQNQRSLDAMREAAVRIDRARGRLRRDDPDEALEIWWALLRGQWSMVEWFDTDERRYILAIPNAPTVPDPRGLTQRESQVVAHAVLGESHKLIAYRLGISRPTASNALRSAMRKLGVKTQAELVAKLRAIREDALDSEAPQPGGNAR